MERRCNRRCILRNVSTQPEVDAANTPIRKGRAVPKERGRERERENVTSVADSRVSAVAWRAPTGSSHCRPSTSSCTSRHERRGKTEGEGHQEQLRGAAGAAAAEGGEGSGLQELLVQRALLARLREQRRAFLPLPSALTLLLFCPLLRSVSHLTFGVTPGVLQNVVHGL